MNFIQCDELMMMMMMMHARMRGGSQRCGNSWNFRVTTTDNAAI